MELELTPINTKQSGDRGYICFYGDKKVALYATSTYKAQQMAIAYLKVPKSKRHLVSPYLCENEDGSQYVQSTAF